MMRFGLAMLAGMMLLLSGSTALAFVTILDNAASRGGALMQVVKPGDAFDIVGDCLALAQTAENVRVVLALNDSPNTKSIGYRDVLATEQKLSTDSLHVRVPDAPEMNNHVFRVRVFALDGGKPATCEAGDIRIG